MSASYPAAAKSFTAINNGDTVTAVMWTGAYDEITALEQALLTGGLAHDLKFVDATYDIGKSGATRPRHLYLSGNAVVGGTLTVGGVAVSTAAVIQTTTSTGSVNDFAATSARHLVLRCNNASALTLNGFAAGSDGDTIDVVSINAQVNLAHQAGGSTAANRLINFATSGNTSLAAGSGFARYIYDATTARWRLTDHEQGAWIDQAYAGTDFTSDSGTWTVDSGDLVFFRYWLKGRTLWVMLSITPWSKSAASTDLNIKIPGGFAPLNNVGYLGVIYANNNGTIEADYAVSGTAGSLIILRRFGGNWAIAANASSVGGTLPVEVT